LRSHLQYRVEAIVIIDRFIKWSRRKYSREQRILRFIPVGLFFLLGFPLILFSCQTIDRELNLPKLLIEPYNLLLASILVTFGLFFAIWATLALFKVGEGTPVPTIPTQKLVTTGPYTLCRNPMTFGIVVYYLGISLWLNSLFAVILTTLFLLCSIAYIKLVEEKELKARFGREYEEYKRKTRFLIPRLKRRES